MEGEKGKKEEDGEGKMHSFDTIEVGVILRVSRNILLTLVDAFLFFFRRESLLD